MARRRPRWSSHPTTHRGPITRLAIGLAVATAAFGVAGCQPTVPGLRIETGPADTYPPSIRIWMTTARSLTVRCSAANKVEINGAALTIDCDAANPLLVYGSDGNDIVDLDLRRFAHAGCAYLGDGDDVAILLHRGSTDTNLDPTGCLWGGNGDDTLAVGFDPATPYRTRYTGAASRLEGDAGNDRLIDLGYLSDPTLSVDGDLAEARLGGGLGADQLVGAPTRPTSYDTDLDDTINWGDTPKAVQLDVPDNPTIVVHNRNKRGTKVSVSRQGATTSVRYPDLLTALVVYGGGQGSHVTVDGKSQHTSLRLRSDSYLDDGHGHDNTIQGNDVLVLRPRNPFTWDQFSHTVTQPGAQPWTYDTFANVTLEPAAT